MGMKMKGMFVPFEEILREYQKPVIVDIYLIGGICIGVEMMRYEADNLFEWFKNAKPDDVFQVNCEEATSIQKRGVALIEIETEAESLD